MNKTIWKQTDSRWAKKAYPSGSTVGGCGCGLLACTHIAMEQESKKDWTPDNLRSWMVSKGYAVRGQGTRWEGITETLKHIGHKNVVRIYDKDPMTMAWKELNKGNRIGIILFDSHVAPNGVKWTASGHYVAFTDYYVKGNKHYFYCKDSGGRNHSGIFSYENSMRGCIPKMWIVERVGKQTNGSAVVKSDSVSATSYRPSMAYKGSLPTSVVKNGSKGASVKAVQTFLNWCVDSRLVVDSNAGAKTIHAIKVYQKTYGLTVDGIFGSASKAKAQAIINSHKPRVGTSVQDKACEWARKIANDNSYKYVAQTKSDSPANHCCICKGYTGKYKGFNCIRFVGASYAHGAGIRIKSADHKLVTTDMANRMLKSTNATAQKIWCDRNGDGWVVIRNGNKKLPTSMLKRGDILICFDKEGSSACYKHMALYQGNGMITDAANATVGIVTRKYTDLSRKPLLALRYTK